MTTLPYLFLTLNAIFPQMIMVEPLYLKSLVRVK